MHPMLVPEKQLDCQQIINDLDACHNSTPLAKFIGSCNSIKTALNHCLDQDYQMRREANKRKALDRQERYEKRVLELNRAERDAKAAQ